MIKAAFWISVVVIALPLLTGENGGYPADYEPEPVQLHEIAFMVQAISGDVLSMCDRDPKICETGNRLLWTIRETATNVAGKAHVWLSEGPAEAQNPGN